MMYDGTATVVGIAFSIGKVCVAVISLKNNTIHMLLPLAVCC